MIARPDGRTSVREALRNGRRLLESLGSDEAEIEAELLLMHTMGVDRVHLLQRLNEPLPSRAASRYRRFLDRRAANEPTAYIVGHREFYGLDFEVTHAALIPRPETEVLVEISIDWVRHTLSRPATIVDVGVGCGTIAVALAKELPDARLIGIDTSKRALGLARRNAERHGVADRIDFRHGSLLSPLTGPVDVIASNLPYVRTADWFALPPHIREYEPRSALDGGPDGLRLIRRLLKNAPDHLHQRGALFAEIGDDEGDQAKAEAARYFPDSRIQVRPDLAGLDRVLCVEVS